MYIFLLFSICTCTRSVPVGQLYTIDPTLGRFGTLILSTLAAVCTSDGER